MSSDLTQKGLVYVVLLNWNGWRDTITCLNSLSHLDYPVYNILVVDNGSTDDSAGRLRAVFPDISLLETGINLGFSGGCNAGIRCAFAHGAEYVWLLNNDTTVDSRALQAMIAMAESDERLGAVGSVLYWMKEPNRIQVWGGGWVSFWTGRSGHHYSPVPAHQLHYVTGASLLLRRNALDDIGLLDDNTFFMYWEDVDLCFRLRKRGWRLAVAEDSIILHKQAASTGGNNPTLAFYGARSSLRFFLRHSPLPTWTIAIGTMGRLFKQLLRLQGRQMVAVIKGTCFGGKYKHIRTPYTQEEQHRLTSVNKT
ncbi:MAG TPA: glycosyltransferase family 2 protein [Terriglobia bacterium]|nr:glycosyltransferase family 2 protein [Terriglobia bacterium]